MQYPITKLEKIYRTKEGSGIALLASHIRDGKPLERSYPDVIFSNADEDNIADRAIDDYRYLIKHGAKPYNIGLISPYTKEQYPYSTHKLNMRIRKMLYGSEANPERPIKGDIVIGTKNNHPPYSKHEFMNGQRGMVVKSDSFELSIQFEGNDDIETFEPSELELNGLPKDVVYGYATTIHKSQGGEYAHVIAIVPKNVEYTFGKPALYTAFTRARQTLTIMGAIDKIPGIIERPEKRRYTALKSLLGLPLELKREEIKKETPVNSPQSTLRKPLVMVDIKARLAAIAKANENAKINDEELEDIAAFQR